MAHWLGRKYQRNMPAILRRYLTGIRSEPNSHAGLTRGVQSQKRLDKVLHNPYTKAEKIERERHFSYEDLWTGNEQGSWMGRSARRSALPQRYHM